MRVSIHSRFPHPVLNPETLDYDRGEFSVSFTAVESLNTGALALDHEITLSEPAIADLVKSGEAAIGCLIKCNDTYFSELRPLSWPRGRSEFAPGTLLNRVSLQPMIWLAAETKEWDPGSLHSEFEPPIALSRGDILAISPAFFLPIGQAKLAPLESIFELRKVDEMTEGRFAVDAESDRIQILVSPQTFETINLLRGQTNGQAVALNAIYLPAVMEVLDLLRTELENYSGYRWYLPFIAKCDAKGVVLGSDHVLLENAQVLLGSPAASLNLLVDQQEA